jgi:hypothetical protein
MTNNCKVITYLIDGRPETARAIADNIGLSVQQSQNVCSELYRIGVLDRNDKAHTYTLSKKLSKPANKKLLLAAIRDGKTGTAALTKLVASVGGKSRRQPAVVTSEPIHLPTVTIVDAGPVPGLSAETVTVSVKTPPKPTGIDHLIVENALVVAVTVGASAHDGRDFFTICFEGRWGGQHAINVPWTREVINGFIAACGARDLLACLCKPVRVLWSEKRGPIIGVTHIIKDQPTYFVSAES